MHAHDANDLIHATGHGRPARPASAGVTPIFQVEVARHPDELTADVQRLLERAGARNAEFGLDWYRNLVDTVYGAHDGVRFYVLRKGRHPVAVLPVRFEGGRFGQRVASLSNFYTTLYEPALESGLSAHELHLLLAQLARDAGRVASLTLAPMDTASDAYATLMGALRMVGWHAFEYFTFGNWYLPVQCGWSDYLKTRSGVLRSTLKRMDKKFGHAGGRLEIVSGGPELEQAIAAYRSVYDASWKQPEPFPDFMPGLIRSCADNGSLRLGLAWIDGKPVAAQLWIVADGRAAIYKLAYHEDYKAYSPGSLLTAMLMASALDSDQVREVDYLCGDDAYKSQWMSHRRERGGIVAYNPRTLAGLAGLSRQVLGQWARSLKRRLRATPAPVPAAEPA